MDIREKIDHILFEFGTLRISYQEARNQILAAIEEDGYVRLAEDQSLPIVYGFGVDGEDVEQINLQLKAQQDMLSAGWRKVEEVKNDII